MEGKISNLKTVQFKCKNCGADLTFSPGTNSVECSFCGTLNKITDDETKDIPKVKEDYRQILIKQKEKEDILESFTAECKTCGSLFEVEAGISSTECPFCASPVVVEGGSTRRIKPKSLIPFKISEESAKGQFSKWIKKLWFAPKELKDMLILSRKLKGIYIPYWSFDMNVISYYDGERGDDHTETENYTTFEKGKEVTKSNQITVTDWSPASGVIFHSFNNISIPATHSVPNNLLDQVAGWNIKNIENFREEYLSGFISECYTVDVVDGFSEAVDKTGSMVKDLIREDIGGEHQKISSMKTSYDKIKFRHILYPLWVSSYKFKKKTYRFLINGSTGKIIGERPWSFKKIFTLIASIIAVIAILIIIF